MITWKPLATLEMEFDNWMEFDSFSLPRGLVEAVVISSKGDSVAAEPEKFSGDSSSASSSVGTPPGITPSPASSREAAVARDAPFLGIRCQCSRRRSDLPRART